MKLILAVDIGNTTACVGLVHGKRVTNVRRIVSKTSSAAHVRRFLAGYRRHARRIEGSILCSVVPSLNSRWTSALSGLLGRKPLVVDHRLKLGVAVNYPRPETIGADRLANAAGGSAKYGAPVIIADFGTALTFDVVSARNEYIGGVIEPGLPFMTDYLAEKTALLPHIKVHGRLEPVGRSTVSAMRIGAKIGYAGMVREVVRYLCKSLKMRNVTLCGTGGYAEWVLSGLDMDFKLDPDLTLFGLGRIYELNKGSRRLRQ